MIGPAEQRLLPVFPTAKLRNQLFIVGGLAVLAVLLFALPLEEWHIPRKHYLPVHTLMEFLSIVAAFLVFTVVWHTPAREISTSQIFLAVALFSAGWLDIAHTLSFRDMPDMITPSSGNKSIGFWLMARLTVAVALCVVSFYPQLKPPTLRTRILLMGGFLLANAIIFWAIVFHEADLPDSFVPGTGITPFKIGFERVITALQVIAACRFYLQARKSDDDSLTLLFGAAAVCAFSEVFLTTYATSNDAQNLFGHLLKIASYILLYRAMFVVSVRNPYKRLSLQTATLEKANETLQMQSLALESTTNPIVVSDLDGTIQWRNRASRALQLEIDAHPDVRPNLFGRGVTPDIGMADTMRRTLEAGKVWRGTVVIPDISERNLILDRVVSPVFSDDGVIQGYVSVSENVTDRVNAESRHKRVIDSAIDGFCVTDENGRLLEVNKAYVAMSGFSAEELLARHMPELIANGFEAAFRVHAGAVIKNRYARFETHHQHKSGHGYPVEISATYEPELRQFFVFVRNLSDMVRARNVQRTLELQLQHSQKVQALGELTGGIAHDFNNILATVLGYSNLALTRFVPDKQSKLALYLKEIVAAGERARDLIAKMLIFARSEPRKAAGLISPANVVRDVVSMVRPSIPATISLSVEVDETLQIRMDAGELNQVLVNLVINARDAIDGYGSIDIQLRRVALDGQLCIGSPQLVAGEFIVIEVSDSGCGIPPEHLPRLFDPFFTTKEVGKGTGLGLSMVLGILRRAGAFVSVESEPGKGSRFRLLFTAEAAPEPVSDSAQAKPLAQVGTGQHIWVVDDEPAITRYLRELLESSGYRVSLFSDPADALAALQDERSDVDLLISDQTMPGLTGADLLARLHAVKPLLPAILCTGFGDVMDSSQVLEKHFRRIFLKPVPAPDLLAAVAELLRRD